MHREQIANALRRDGERLTGRTGPCIMCHAIAGAVLITVVARLDDQDANHWVPRRVFGTGRGGCKVAGRNRAHAKLLSGPNRGPRDTGMEGKSIRSSHVMTPNRSGRIPPARQRSPVHDVSCTGDRRLCATRPGCDAARRGARGGRTRSRRRAVAAASHAGSPASSRPPSHRTPA